MMQRIWQLPDDGARSLRPVVAAASCGTSRRRARRGSRRRGSTGSAPRRSGSSTRAPRRRRSTVITRRRVAGAPRLGRPSDRRRDADPRPRRQRAAARRGRRGLHAPAGSEREDVPLHRRRGEGQLDDGWESLGDMGWMDDDGYLFLADRAADMILAGGANIYPAEIEAALDEHPRGASSCGDRPARRRPRQPHPRDRAGRRRRRHRRRPARAPRRAPRPLQDPARRSSS